MLKATVTARLLHKQNLGYLYYLVHLGMTRVSKKKHKRQKYIVRTSYGNVRRSDILRFSTANQAGITYV
jgi:hypothetical protein